jgi:hypothetical protein
MSNTSRLPKRARYTPYLEIALTVAVMAFLVFVVAGGFNRSPDDVAGMDVRP